MNVEKIKTEQAEHPIAVELRPEESFD